MRPQMTPPWPKVRRDEAPSVMRLSGPSDEPRREEGPEESEAVVAREVTPDAWGQGKG